MIYIGYRQYTDQDFCFLYELCHFPVDIHRDDPCRIYYRQLLEAGFSPDDLIPSVDRIILYENNRIDLILSEFVFIES